MVYVGDAGDSVLVGLTQRRLFKTCYVLHELTGPEKRKPTQEYEDNADAYLQGLHGTKTTLATSIVRAVSC